MIVTSSTTVDVKYGTEAKDLKAALMLVPDNAKVSIETYVGDQRDPGYKHITFSWTEIR